MSATGRFDSGRVIGAEKMALGLFRFFDLLPKLRIGNEGFAVSVNLGDGALEGGKRELPLCLQVHLFCLHVLFSGPDFTRRRKVIVVTKPSIDGAFVHGLPQL